MTITKYWTLHGTERVYPGCNIRFKGEKKTYYGVTAEWLRAHGFKRVAEEEVTQEVLDQSVDGFVEYSELNETFWVHYVLKPEEIEIDE